MSRSEKPQETTGQVERVDHVTDQPEAVTDDLSGGGVVVNRDEELAASLIHAVRAEGLTPAKIGPSYRFTLIVNALLKSGWLPPDAVERLIAENAELRIAIHGCQCPAPYDECPHDEPFLAAVNRLTAENARWKERVVDLLSVIVDAGDILSTAGAASRGTTQ